MEWIETARGVPYFQTEAGLNWTPVGHNDALTWPTLQGVYRRKDTASVQRYLAMLAERGVTVLRIMLEYNHGEHRYLERPAGTFNTRMVRFWDDLLALCEHHGIRVLLTPFDTFWLWRRWKRHPYNRKNGGPAPALRRILVDAGTRDAIKGRLEFATRRWGSSGVIFAWDLWNEIHPAMAEDSAEPIYGFIEDVSALLRDTEQRLYGRTHPQTVSLFGPIGLQYPLVNSTVLTHPSLNFATTHFYEEGTIDCPRNTLDAAISTGAIMRDVLTQTPPSRPFFDSESGPIHSFKDKRKTLPAEFDDEYFRHMQWAHCASGGAGGGMRWPNRTPHVLTPGMHRAQQGLSAFLPLIDWRCFHRRNWNREVQVASQASIAVFACGDRWQAVIWLLRRDALDQRKQVMRSPAAEARLTLPGMELGHYNVTLWDTLEGCALQHRSFEVTGAAPPTLAAVPIPGDVAIAITPKSP